MAKKNTVPKLTAEENLTILEIARVALADAELFDYIVDKLDISDKEMQSLGNKIESIMN